MTNRELISLLMKYPEDCVIVYRHNKQGRIDVDYIDYTEEVLLSGNKQHFLTLEATFEES